MPTIAGNVGGAAGSGATVQLRNKANTTQKRLAADGSGNFSFTVADNDVYLIEASIAGFTIRQKYEVPVYNGQNVAAVNFTLSAINSSNS